MKKENNELQSRREFFKKAAKGALPILGAVILASSPIISKATETPMGCDNSCLNVCRDDCTATCKGTCNWSCQTSCYGSCSNTCHGTCSGGCARQAYA